MAPSKSSTQRPPGLLRQLSLQQSPPCTPAAAPAPVRRGLLRRQRSAEDDRPVTRLLHSALRVTASALGPGFLADTAPLPPPPAPPTKLGRLRPVRVAWAELRKPSSSNSEQQAETVAVVAQKVGISKPNTNHNARPPTCLPALARANLDIFLAHSGLAQCLASAVLSDPPPPAQNTDRPLTPAALLSPREPIKALPVPSKPPATPQLPANARRVNFRSTAFRAINRSLSDSSAPELKPPEQKNGRVLSAPAHRATPLVVPPRPMLRSLPRRGPLQSSFDNGDRGPEQLAVPTERNIRSAPPRRRLKAAGRKKGGGRRGEESSGDDEVEETPAAPQRASSAGGRGRRGLCLGAEIVTMVSLVSPAGSSDSEDERSPRPLGSPSSRSATPETKPHVMPPDIVCARKITKSVSFQARGVMPGLLRRASSTLALPTTSGVTISSEVITSRAVVSHGSPQGLQKPTPTCNPPNNAPPQQPDCRVRRKLLRTKAVHRNDSESGIKCTAPLESSNFSPDPAASNTGETIKSGRPVTQPVPTPSPVTKRAEPVQEGGMQQLEEKPQFETPKEQECWHLYRKMCEKGLTVSFDTVLRGMLTPTEYRLRRGALLSTC